MRLYNWLSGQTWPMLLVISLLLVLIIGYIDYATGYDAHFGIFYVIPLFVSVCCAEVWLPLAVSLANTVVWILADVWGGHTGFDDFYLYWNAGTRLAFFLIITHLGHALRMTVEREKRMARTDYLTGALNSRAFYGAARTEISRSERTKRPLTIAYIDLDNFKAVNDKFGHAEGDRVLMDFAGILLDCSRKSDIPCRLGGDEFVILMKTDPGGAVLMRNRVEESFLEYQKKESRLGIGLSIGAAFASPGEPLFEVDTMMRAADNEMYRHKHSRSPRSAPEGV